MSQHNCTSSHIEPPAHGSGQIEHRAFIEKLRLVTIPLAFALTISGVALSFIAGCTFTETYDGVQYEMGTVSRYADGRVELGNLRNDTTIQGIPCRGASQIMFYENGKVQSARLSADSTFDGILFRTGSSMRFHPNGRVKEGKLAKATAIGGVTCDDYAIVEFRENGKFKKGSLAEDTVIQGIAYRKLRDIWFWENGQVQEGTLAVETVVQGMRHKADEKVKFAEDGTTSYPGALVANATINHVQYSVGTNVEFHENGKIKSAHLSGNTIIQGLSFKEATWVEFDEDGLLKEGILAANATIKDTAYKAGTWVAFDKMGLVAETRKPGEELAPLTAALQLGTFINQPEGLSLMEKLLHRQDPRGRAPGVVDCLVSTGVQLLTDEAAWKDERLAFLIFHFLKHRHDGKAVVDSLVRKVSSDAPNRPHLLFLAVKLGIAGTEARLNQVLLEHGNVRMAEDFLNSGSLDLRDGAKRWAEAHGHAIETGRGSHRVSWGQF